MSKKNKYISKSLATAPTTGKLGKTPPININHTEGSYEIDYFHFYQSLYRKEIDDWKEARIIRRDPFRPSTYYMQQLYNDAMLDIRLYKATETRIMRVVNKQFLLMDKNGVPDVERSKFLKKKWFKHIVKRAIESKFYGYSAILLQDLTPDRIPVLKDIPRENVIPELGIILKNAMNQTGEHLTYADFPNYIVYMQLESDAVGLLEKLTPLTIFKRHSWASWDEFEQIFGVPLRIARTMMIDNKKHTDELQSWLETMGTSAYAIFDKRVDLEVKENNRSDAHQVFSQKISIINQEISIGVLGQTMTTEDGASRSQAEVHSETLEEITTADIADVEEWFNDEFAPVLRNWGYDIPDGYTLQITSTAQIKPIDKIKIDGVLMQNGFNLDHEYIEQTYEVKLDGENPKSEKTETQKQPEALSFFV